MRIFINKKPYEVSEGEQIEAWHSCDGCSQIGINFESSQVTLEPGFNERIAELLPNRDKKGGE